MSEELSLRQQILLVFLADSERAIDPVRIMKALFVFAMETPDEWLPAEGKYNFAPYHYGPYAPQIYGDLDFLTYIGYVMAHQNPDRSWKRYSITPEGAEVARTITESLDPRVVGYLHRLREYVGQLTFKQLLVKIYKRYPDYAVNSVFQY